MATDHVLYMTCDAPEEIEYRGWFMKNVLTAASDGDHLSLVRLTKLMHHMRYLNVQMPPRLHRLVATPGRNILYPRLGYRMSVEIQETLEVKASVPDVFSQI